MATLDYGDVLALSEGTVYVTIDGRNIALIEVKEATAKIEFNKEDVRGLGKRMTGQKVTGASGSGDLTLYTLSSEWNKLMARYLKDGYLPKISMTATMEDKSSSVGKQVVTLSGFMPDEISLFNLEADDGISENEMGFTFDDFIMPEAFKEPKR